MTKPRETAPPLDMRARRTKQTAAMRTAHAMMWDNKQLVVWVQCGLGTCPSTAKLRVACTPGARVNSSRMHARTFHAMRGAHRRQADDEAVELLAGLDLAAEARRLREPEREVKHVVLVVARLLSGHTTSGRAAQTELSACDCSRRNIVAPPSRAATRLQPREVRWILDYDVTCAACQRPLARALRGATCERRKTRGASAGVASLAPPGPRCWRARPLASFARSARGT